MELAGEISKRDRPTQLEYLGTKMHLTALSTSAESQTESCGYIPISFGLGISNARKLSVSVELGLMTEVIHMHKYLQMRPSECLQMMFFSIVVTVNK